MHWGSLSGYLRFFFGVKRPEHDGDNWPSSNAEVKNEWSYTSSPTVCLHGLDRKNVYLLP